MFIYINCFANPFNFFYKPLLYFCCTAEVNEYM